MKFQIKQFLEYDHEFLTMDPFTSYISFRKRILSIRISLNIMRSTQVFNGVLYKNSYFILKRFFNKNVEKWTSTK